MRLVFIGLIVLASAAAGAALKIGEPAPPIEAEKWLNGTPVNPAKPDSNTIYVVEFFIAQDPVSKAALNALADLDRRYREQSVVVVGITEEPEEVITNVAARLNLDFRIALDANGTTADRYLLGIDGVPHAFVVSPEGRILWSGHPLSGLESVIEAVLKKTFDPAKAARVQEAEMELQSLLYAGETTQALSKVNALIQLDSRSFEYHQIKLGLLAQLEHTTEIKKTYREMMTLFQDSALDLNTLAWIAVSSGPFELRDLETAWKAAQRAVELSERRSAEILDTWARVHYELGFLEEAARLQAEAVAAAKDLPVQAELQSVLQYYRDALRLREKVKADVREKKPTPAPAP